jgi:hypothetical protein
MRPPSDADDFGDIFAGDLLSADEEALLKALRDQPLEEPLDPPVKSPPSAPPASAPPPAAPAPAGITSSGLSCA